jgi:hypothetical protein
MLAQGTQAAGTFQASITRLVGVEQQLQAALATGSGTLQQRIALEQLLARHSASITTAVNGATGALERSGMRRPSRRPSTASAAGGLTAIAFAATAGGGSLQSMAMAAGLAASSLAEIWACGGRAGGGIGAAITSRGAGRRARSAAREAGGAPAAITDPRFTAIRPSTRTSRRRPLCSRRGLRSSATRAAFAQTVQQLTGGLRPRRPPSSGRPRRRTRADRSSRRARALVRTCGTAVSEEATSAGAHRRGRGRRLMPRLRAAGTRGWRPSASATRRAYRPAHVRARARGHAQRTPAARSPYCGAAGRAPRRHRRPGRDGGDAAGRWPSDAARAQIRSVQPGAVEAAAAIAERDTQERALTLAHPRYGNEGAGGARAAASRGAEPDRRAHGGVPPLARAVGRRAPTD